MTPEQLQTIKTLLRELFDADRPPADPATHVLIIPVGRSPDVFLFANLADGSDAVTPGALVQGTRALSLVGLQLFREAALASARLDQILADKLGELSGDLNPTAAENHDAEDQQAQDPDGRG